MECTTMTLGGMPAVCYGAPAGRVWLFIHGQCGSKAEAEAFAQIVCPTGAQVVGVDLPQHGARAAEHEGFNPWTAAAELRDVMVELRKRWGWVGVRANSIGAYFALLAFADGEVDRALFVSPIADMQALIAGMMAQAGVDEARLREAGEIPTGAGATLSWAYLCWVRAHPTQPWRCPTAILYGEGDVMTDRKTIETFAAARGAALSVVPGAEHWFHTREQLEALRAWERENC